MWYRVTIWSRTKVFVEDARVMSGWDGRTKTPEEMKRRTRRISGRQSRQKRPQPGKGKRYWKTLRVPSVETTYNPRLSFEVM